MKRYLSILFIFTAFAVSCNKQPAGENTTSGIIITKISLPSRIETEAGANVTLNLRGDTGIDKNDKVVLRSVSNNSFDCPIVSVSASKLVFTMNRDVVNGKYSFYIARGSEQKKVGSTEVFIIKHIDVTIPEGVNIYGLVTCGDDPVPDVIVSDGYEVTTTGADGVYFLKSLKENGYVFMTIPAGYEVSSDGILPEFHSAVSTDAKVVDRVDFSLTKVNNDNFTLFVLGDMHLANRNSTTSDMSQFDTFAADLNKTLSATSGKKYMLTLGDMTWDLYWYDNKFEFLNYLGLMNQKFKDIQVFHTMGNHDNDMNEVGDFAKEFKYRRDIAPTYYSYNIGKVHFIVLDDIDYNNVAAGKDHRGEYVLDITSRQMNWLRKDLSFVPKGTEIVVSTHAPIFYPNSNFGWSYNLTGANSTGEANTAALISAFNGYKVTFLTGHTHRTFVCDKMSSNNYRELNAGSVCGDWWWSGHLSGVLMAQDGAPAGYTVMKFNGENFDWQYRATGRPADYQFRAYDMNVVRETVKMTLANGNERFRSYVNEYNSSKFAANDILLNIWNYDASWNVKVTENGKALTPVKVYTYDPLHVIAMSAKRLAAADNPSFITAQWIHFYRYTASSATSTIEIEVTDRFGNVSRETMTRPKDFTIANYK
jgi:hypothetical protein